MKKFYNNIGKIALVSLIIGCVLIGIAMLCGVNNRSFKSKYFNFIINPKVEKLEYTIIDDFDSIDLNIDMADIVIKEGKEFAIEYALFEGASYKIKNNTLYVDKYGGEKIMLGLNFKSKDNYLTIYIPKDTEINIKHIDADMGNIEILNDSAWALKNVNIDADMGNVNIEGNVEGKINIDADMGDIDIKGHINEDITINADMGDVDIKGYLLGDISVDADMGDVDICTYYNEKYYDYEIDVDLGDKDINRDGGEMLEEEYKFDIEVECDMGDVELTFTDR